MKKHATQKKTRVIWLVSVMLLAAVLLPTVVSCAAELATPEKLFEGALDKTFDKIADWELPRILDKVLNGGSISVVYETERDGKTDLTLYLNAKENRVAFKANTKDADKDDSSLFLFVDDDKAVVKSSELSDGAWGLTYKGADRRLTRSLFAPDSGSEYALSETAYKNLRHTLTALETAADSTDALKKLVEQARDVLIKSLVQNASFSKDVTDTEVLDETVEAVLVTVELDGDILCDALADAWDFMQDSDDFMDVVEAVERINEDGQDGTNTAGVIGGVNTDIRRQVNDALDDLRDSLKTMDFTVKLYFNNRQSTLMRVDAEVVQRLGDQVEKIHACIELGKTLKTFEGFRLTLNMTEGGMYSNEPAVVEVKIDETDSRTEIEVYVTDSVLIGADRETGQVAKLSLNKKNGKLDMTVSGEGGFTLEGIYTANGGTHTLEVTRLTRYQARFDNDTNKLIYDMPETVIDGSTDVLTLTVKEKNKMPTAGKYTDILAAREKDREVIDRLRDVIGDLLPKNQ